MAKRKKTKVDEVTLFDSDEEQALCGTPSPQELLVDGQSSHSQPEHPLKIALPFAVTLRILEYQRRGGPLPMDFERAQRFGEVLGEKGDILLFSSKKKGESAEMFNGLADAVAILSFCPGGVKVFGHHFEGLKKNE